MDNRRAALHLWISLNRATNAISSRLEQQVASHGLTLVEFGALEALYHKGELPIGAVGDIVLRTSGSMTYVIDKLEKRGLLQRHNSHEDRRRLFVKLTGKGKLLVDKVFPEHGDLIVEIMNSLSFKEKRDTAANLRRVRNHVESMIPESHA